MKRFTLLMVLLSASLLAGGCAGVTPQLVADGAGYTKVIAQDVGATKVADAATKVEQAAQQAQAASNSTQQSADKITATLQTVQAVANAANSQNVPYAGVVGAVAGIGLMIYSAINKQTAVKQALATPAPAQVVATTPVIPPQKPAETTQVTSGK